MEQATKGGKQIRIIFGKYFSNHKKRKDMFAWGELAFLSWRFSRKEGTGTNRQWSQAVIDIWYCIYISVFILSLHILRCFFGMHHILYDAHDNFNMFSVRQWVFVLKRKTLSLKYSFVPIYPYVSLPPLVLDSDSIHLCLILAFIV